MRKNFTTFVLGFIGSISLLYSQNQPVASFSAEESKKEIYKQGFDSSDGMTDWSIVSQNTANTWKVGQVKKSGLPAFSTIDPASQNSDGCVLRSERSAKRTAYFATVYSDKTVRLFILCGVRRSFCLSGSYDAGSAESKYFRNN
ncbi:MAG: hypothetical protein ACLVKO_01045 [Dysgonomonas sp.]